MLTTTKTSPEFRTTLPWTNSIPDTGTLLRQTETKKANLEFTEEHPP